MKISAPKESYIFIELSDSDMKKLNISFDGTGRSLNGKSRIVKLLIDEAERSLGKKIEISDKARIETLPSIDGGCLLFFSAREKPLCYKLKKRTAGLVYRIDDIDDLLDLMGIIKEKDVCGVSGIPYIVEGRMLLVLKGKLKHSLLMKINEYLSPERDRRIRGMLTSENRLTEGDVFSAVCKSV